MAGYDNLTGTYDLKTFIEKCSEFLKGNNERYAMASMDISNFKIVNDHYGMEKADELVIAFANWLSDMERSVYITRVVGDQFRVLFKMNDCTIEEVAREIGESNKAFCKKMTPIFSETMWHIYAAIYEIEDNNEKVRNMIDKAHYAKKETKGNYEQKCTIYSNEKFSEYAHTMEIVKNFERACETEDDIIVKLQPKYSISTGKVIGAEALGRMKDKDGNMIMPGDFIPVLEKTRLITKFDSIIMKKTFQVIRQWLDLGYQVVPISINVSRIQLLNDDFANRVLALREQYDIPPNLIEIEITESIFMKEVEESFMAANSLRKAGIRIDLDDFGAGYTALNMMGVFPADIIKLDCGFVRNSLNTEIGKTIIESVITMLQKVGFEVICEGIETLEQAMQIKDFGCDFAQGFYFDRPMSVQDFERKLLKNEL